MPKRWVFIPCPPTALFQQALPLSCGHFSFVTRKFTSQGPCWSPLVPTHPLCDPVGPPLLGCEYMLLSNASSCAWCKVRPKKWKHWSLKRKVYCWAKQGEQSAHVQKSLTPWWFWGRVFIGKIWGEWCRMCDFVWWWGNRAIFQEFCAQPEVTVLHLGGGLSSCRRTQRYCHVYSFKRNQDFVPSLHYCFLTAPPLFLHSLPSLISNCLDRPFGTQRRSRRLKPSSYK